jgi:ribose transport system permease protein
VAGIAISTFAGFINGTLLTRLDLPHPYVATLGMKNVLLGIALLITHSTTIGFTNKGVDPVMFLGSATIGGFPVSFIFVLIVYSIFSVFLNKSSLGRQIYCVGGNAEAARLSGIRSKDVLTFVYTLSGFMCGLAGVMLVGRIATANANAGLSFDTDAIASCIIGGASFSGGKGTIWGTMIGALLIGTIRNGSNLLGMSNDVQFIVIGAVIILAVTIDVTRGKFEAKTRRMAAAATIEEKNKAQ